MSKCKYNTIRAIAQVAEMIIGVGAVLGSIYIVCRIASALLALAGVA